MIVHDGKELLDGCERMDKLSWNTGIIPLIEMRKVTNVGRVLE